MDHQKDYYKILGVSESASQEEIKKAYRKLAKQFHPDTRAGDKTSEERFKNLSEAYAVLKDNKKRQEYDMMRKNPFAGRQSGFDFQGSSGRRATSSDFGNFGESFGFDDILSNFFGLGGKKTRSRFDFGEDSFSRTRSRSRQKGEDFHASIDIPFEMTIQGGETFVWTPAGKKVKLKIAAGTEDGKRVKMTGYGSPSLSGGQSGDLYITIHVAGDPRFERKGNDIYSTEAIDFAQALLGSEIEVTTVYNQKVKLKIPPGTDSGKIFRLKKLGIHSTAGAGDHYVTVTIRTPKNLSNRTRRQFEDWARAIGMLDKE